LINEFTSINDNSDEFIYNYFAELERKVDVKREELIGEIHRISDKLLAEIGGHKKEIQSQQEKRTKKQSCDREQLRQYQAELDAYNGELKEYSVDLNRWKEVQTETESKRQELAVKIEDLKKEIMCSRAVSFEEGQWKVDSEQLFGKIVVEDTQVKVTQVGEGKSLLTAWFYDNCSFFL
jgi:chromosome segregation ATPase